MQYEVVSHEVFFDEDTRTCLVRPLIPAHYALELGEVFRA